MTEEVIDRRAANALFAEAHISPKAEKAVRFGGVNARAVTSVLDELAEAQGGLWVGGCAVLTRGALHFEPNKLNRLTHTDGDRLRLEIPLREIELVTYRFGWVTGFIEIGSCRGTFSLRSFRAKAFADAIRSAAALVHHRGEDEERPPWPC